MKKHQKTLILAQPRGFCAGVDRAIQIVEKAIEKFGAPVYVRHEIVHNRYVVEDLERKGAIFVDEVHQVPADRPVIFSAHGVPKSVPLEAQSRQMIYVDATCPSVSKVHFDAERHFKAGNHILLIGHKGHPEVIGTMGQLPEGSMSLIETVQDARDFVLPDGVEENKLAFVTQTTLSVDDTKDIIAVLMQRFSSITAPRHEDICYATTNRQDAVKVLAEKVDHIIVIGAPNSSNSVRLVEVALKAGCKKAQLIQRADIIEWNDFEDSETIGITAGASAPEILVEEVIAAFKERYDIAVEFLKLREENVHFKLPRIVMA